MPPSYPTGLGGYPASQASAYGSPSPALPYGSPPDAPFASWGTRVGGYLIDLVIFIPVLIVLAVLFRHVHVLDVHFVDRRHGTTQRSFSLLSFVVSGVIFLGYATILIGGPRGQTVGMMAVGVRAVRDGGRQVVGYGPALGRSLVELVLRLVGVITVPLLGLIWLLDMLWPLWDGRKQTVHDKVVSTVVISLRPTR